MQKQKQKVRGRPYFFSVLFTVLIAAMVFIPGMAMANDQVTNSQMQMVQMALPAANTGGADTIASDKVSSFSNVHALTAETAKEASEIFPDMANLHARCGVIVKMPVAANSNNTLQQTTPGTNMALMTSTVNYKANGQQTFSNDRQFNEPKTIVPAIFWVNQLECPTTIS